MLSFLKWTGSKRYQADWIVSMMPRSISGRYVEMFLGSGIVLLTYLQKHPKASCVANDLCFPLINLWKECRDKPEELIKNYREMWLNFNASDMNHRKQIFNEVRRRFNEDQSRASLFLFLTRTSINGLVRFNSKGLYNAPPHFSRPGMHPDDLSRLILQCSAMIANVEFLNLSYDQIGLGQDDFVYMDPPYAMTKDSMYLGGFDTEAYYAYVEHMPCKWLMSYNGMINGRTMIELPKHLWKHRFLGERCLSTSFNANHGNIRQKRYVQESLYSNYEPDKLLTVEDFE